MQQSVWLVILWALYSSGGHLSEYNEHHKSDNFIPAADSKTNHESFDRKVYEQLFKAKRLEQASAIKSLRAIKDIKKQRSTIKLLLDSIRKVLMEGRIALQGAKQQLTPSELFNDETLREHASRVLENTAFFGEFSLFFPDFIEKILDKDKEYRALYEWSYDFSVKLSLFDERTGEMMNLAGQELGLIPRSENYTNPFRAEAQKEAAIRAAMAQMEKAREEKRAAAASDAKRKRQKGKHGEL